MPVTITPSTMAMMSRMRTLRRYRFWYSAALASSVAPDSTFDTVCSIVFSMVSTTGNDLRYSCWLGMLRGLLTDDLGLLVGDTAELLHDLVHVQHVGLDLAKALLPFEQHVLLKLETLGGGLLLALEQLVLLVAFAERVPVDVVLLGGTHQEDLLHFRRDDLQEMGSVAAGVELPENSLPVDSSSTSAPRG